MSVNWSWRLKIGSISVERERPDNGEKIRFKLNMYQANCVAAVIYEFKEVDPETKKKKDMYRFWCFWNNFDHLKRCIGLKKDCDGNLSNLYNGENDWDRWTKIKLNIYYKEMVKVGELFARAGYKVELYYKEPKVCKKKEK